MAVVGGGALSFAASGTIGKIMTFSSWKGRPYVRRRVIPSNPKSGGQVGVRAGMKWGSKVWATLTSTNQATWEAPAASKAISPFNAFISAGQTHIRNNEGYQREYPAEASSPAGAPTGGSATAATRQITVDWTDPAAGDVFGVLIYRELTTGFTPAPSNLIAIVNAGVETYVDTPLVPDTYYYVLNTFDFAGVLGTPAAEFNGTVT